MLYEINFSKYISEKYPDCWCWKKVNADSKEEAINLLKDYYNKLNRKINYILSIVEIEQRQ